MANLALVTANQVRVVESIEQMTLPAAEDITAGAIVRIDTTNGKFTNANGTSTTENRVYGVATRTVKAGMALTAIAKGVMDGWNITQAYDADIYASDTDGTMADAAGTASKIVAQVIPAWSVKLGTAADKLLRIKC